MIGHTHVHVKYYKHLLWVHHKTLCVRYALSLEHA